MSALEMRDLLAKCCYSRLEIACRMGVPYSTLSGKLNGYSSFTPEEEEAIREIVKNQPK